ncbi:MAG: ABC transporter ATP-binding protein, partial [Mucilaginibacter polytrichastri]|nr:ABC transporter ATP-binding protein [Mucilaginibacter polytrichastri]
MKTYFRLLSFAKPIEKFAIPYIIATLLSILFATLNLTLLSPLFETLIATHKDTTESLTDKASSAFDITGQFREFVNHSIATYGQLETLKYVCFVIVGSVLLSNIFRYFSQRFMEDLRVHTLLNLRRSVFDNVMDLDVGYFNNERKGDIMSKIASDVQV